MAVAAVALVATTSLRGLGQGDTQVPKDSGVIQVRLPRPLR
jgi:hypothetical protein